MTNTELEKALQPLVDLFSNFLGADLAAQPDANAEGMVSVPVKQVDAWRQRIEALEKGVERLKSERDAARSLRDAAMLQAHEAEEKVEKIKAQLEAGVKENEILRNQFATQPAHRLQAELSRRYKELTACRNQRDSYKRELDRQKRINSDLTAAQECATIDGRQYTSAELKVMKDFYYAGRPSQHSNPAATVLLNGTYYTISQVENMLHERLTVIKKLERAEKFFTYKGIEYTMENARKFFAVGKRMVVDGEVSIDGVVYKLRDIIHMGADLVAKDATIRTIETKLNAADNLIKAKVDHIERLKAELAARRDQVGALNGEVAKHLTTIENLKGDVAAKQQILNAYMSQTEQAKLRAEQIAKTRRVNGGQTNSANGVPLTPGVAYMTTPLGTLPVDTDGMRAVSDALNNALAKLASIKQVFNMN